MTTTVNPSLRAQYVRSVDPGVLAVVERNREGRHAASERIAEWAVRQGAAPDGRFWGGGMGILAVGSLDLPTKPEGWVAGTGGRGYRPHKRSAAYQEMEALTWKPEPVPGISGHFSAPRPEGGWGSTWWMIATPFLSFGAAWVMLSNMPTEGEFGPQWVEVKASEAHAAREALLETAA